MKKLVLTLVVCGLVGCGEDVLTPIDRCVQAFVKKEGQDAVNRECNSLSLESMKIAKAKVLEIDPTNTIKIMNDGKEVENETPQKNELKPETTLKITPEQFKSQFNAASLADGFNFQIDSIQLKTGEVNDVANIKLNDISALIVSVSKNGEVNGITSLSVGNGTPESGLSMLELTVTLIRTFNKNISKQQAYKLGMDLFSKVVKEGDKGKADKSINDIKYIAMFSEVTGYWFSVAPVKVDKQ